jgi:hypothetical protein
LYECEVRFEKKEFMAITLPISLAHFFIHLVFLLSAVN